MGLGLLAAAACAVLDGNLNPVRPAEDGVPLPVPEAEVIEALPRLAPEPAAPSGVSDDPGPPGDLLFEEGVIQDLALTLSDSAIRSLRGDPSDQVEATLTWKGVEYHAGVKIKGSSSYRPIGEKPSFKIDVHDYDEVRRIDGLKRLTLNNMIQDPTMLREHAYYWLAARTGVPAPRHGYARVTVNGEPYGLYGIVETMDGRLMKRLWPEDKDGNLYEGSGADFTFARDWFDLQVDGGVVPVEDDIEELVEAVEEAGDDEFGEVLDARFDRDAVLRYLAVDTVTGNDDGYVYNHHNYHAYHLAIADRWALLPWGTDRSFTRPIPPRGDAATPVVGVLAQRCWDDDACEDELEARMREILDLWEPFEAMLADTRALIEEECGRDPRREKDCDLDDIEEFVEGRDAALRSALE